MASLVGKNIDRYHIIEQLGVGGMAVVYRAFDIRLERDVAVKVIRTDLYGPAVLGPLLKRFEREARALAQMEHPNIVGVFDYGELEGSPYLVMQYLPGGTLKKHIGKPMPYQDATRLLLPISSALAFAHRRNIIHRDVKPANILITEEGEPMLSDFGIAKILESEHTMQLTGTGMGIGTPEYMAPEQWLGKNVFQTDIYALGVVFYELITGKKPYSADTPAAVHLMQATEPLPAPRSFVSDLPYDVEKVLFKALAKKPEDRYENMGDFTEALDSLVGSGLAARDGHPVSKEDTAVQTLIEMASDLETQGNQRGALATYHRALSICPEGSDQAESIRSAIDIIKRGGKTTPIREIPDPQPQPVKKKPVLTEKIKDEKPKPVEVPQIQPSEDKTFDSVAPSISKSPIQQTPVGAQQELSETPPRERPAVPKPTTAPKPWWKAWYIWVGLIGVIAVIAVLIITGFGTGGGEEVVGMDENPTNTQEPEPSLAPSETTTPIETTEPSPTSTPTITSTKNPLATATLGIGSKMVSEMDGMEMMYAPEGEFTMGDGDDPNPAHKVWLDSFWIDRTEVTNAQYALCVESGACDPPFATWSNTRSEYYGNPEYNDYPVIFVNWFHAVAYCEWAGRRLPTEAEWEKAARGNNIKTYTSSSVANHSTSDGDTVAVSNRSLNASPYHAWDMSGNVYEWTADWYSINYYSNSPSKNPTGPMTGTNRVMRGGSYQSVSEAALDARSFGDPHNGQSDQVGIRCAASYQDEIEDTATSPNLDILSGSPVPGDLGVITVDNAEELRIIAQLPSTQAILDLVWFSDSRRIALLTPEGAFIYDIHTLERQMFISLEQIPTDLTLSADEARIYIISNDSGDPGPLLVYDAVSGELIGTHPLSSMNEYMYLPEDESLFIVMSTSSHRYRPNVFRVFEDFDLQQVEQWKGIPLSSESLFFPSPDGTILVESERSRTSGVTSGTTADSYMSSLAVWDILTAAQQFYLAPDNFTVYLGVDGSGTSFYENMEIENVIISDVENGLYVILSSSRPGKKLEIRRSEYGVLIGISELEDSENLFCVAASPISSLIASGTIRDISIIEMPDYRPITTVDHTSPLFSFSPDGMMFVVIKNGKSVEFYGIQAE